MIVVIACVSLVVCFPGLLKFSAITIARSLKWNAASILKIEIAINVDETKEMYLTLRVAGFFHSNNMDRCFTHANHFYLSLSYLSGKLTLSE